MYVLLDGRGIVVEADRRYLETMIEDFGAAMARRDDWLNEAQRDLVLAGVEEGLARVRARKR